MHRRQINNKFKETNIYISKTSARFWAIPYIALTPKNPFLFVFGRFFFKLVSSFKKIPINLFSKFANKHLLMANMTKSLIIAFAIFFVVGCGEGTDVPDTVLLDDILTLEVSFGDDDTSLPSEYLLASPRDIDINNANEIFVVDEDMIKIFDMNGSPIKTVGKKGPGPGEFEFAQTVNIGPTGYVSILDRFGISLFLEGDRSLGTPDYKFMEKINFRNSKLREDILMFNGWNNAFLKSMTYLTETKQLIHVSGRKRLDEGKVDQFNGLIINNEGILNTKVSILEEHIYRYTSEGRDASLSFNLDFLNKFSWALATDNRLVYYDSGEDSKNSGGIQVYTLSVISENTENVTQITREYERVEISTEQLNRFDGLVEGNAQLFPELKDFLDGVKDIMRAEKYTIALQEILVNGEFVFAFTYKQNENEELLADIFNLDTGGYVSSAYFPGVPNRIKNGYVYYISRGSEKEFPKIEKYKIDPAVFGSK